VIVFRIQQRAAVYCLVLVALVLAAFASVIAIHNYLAARNLFAADPISALLDTPQSIGIRGLTAVSIRSPDQFDLAAWYVPSTNRAAIVVAGGTNSDRASLLPELRLLAAAGYGVLTFDWPGLGRSGGTVRWDGQARRAVIAAVDWVSRQPDVDPTRIGSLGFSIGGYVLAQVASEDLRIRAVVMAAPPPDFKDYIQLHNAKWGPLSKWPAVWALRGTGLLDPTVAPVNRVQHIAPRPILFVAGGADREVSAQMVTKLYASASQPKTLWIVPGAHHGDYSLVAPVEYARRLNEFYSRGLGLGP
jgi:uncharacterized protein